MKTLPSKMFIDGGDPAETKAADDMLKKAGFYGLDGQTTNPTLIVKSAKTQMKNRQISHEEALGFYKDTVQAMSRVIPKGTVSIQVIGDPATLTVGDMLSQAREANTWIPNAVIKFPCTANGLSAASTFCTEGSVNITLNFSQEQAAAVYVATRFHHPDKDVYISPFVGRLDDRGEKGMDIVANIMQMYRGTSGGAEKGSRAHVKVLTASVRNIGHIHYALWLASDIITIPFPVFTQWAQEGFSVPARDFVYDVPGLVDIPYQEISLEKNLEEYNLTHELTDTGLVKFWQDWKLIVTEKP